jgi:hypothetical protein
MEPFDFVTEAGLAYITKQAVRKRGVLGWSRSSVLDRLTGLPGVDPEKGFLFKLTSPEGQARADESWRLIKETVSRRARGDKKGARKAADGVIENFQERSTSEQIIGSLVDPLAIAGLAGPAIGSAKAITRGVVKALPTGMPSPAIAAARAQPTVRQITDVFPPAVAPRPTLALPPGRQATRADEALPLPTANLTPSFGRELGRGVYFSTDRQIAQGFTEGRAPFLVGSARQRKGTEVVSRFVIPKDTKIFTRDKVLDIDLLEQLQRKATKKHACCPSYRAFLSLRGSKGLVTRRGLGSSTMRSGIRLLSKRKGLVFSFLEAPPQPGLPRPSPSPPHGSALLRKCLRLAGIRHQDR